MLCRHPGVRRKGSRRVCAACGLTRCPNCGVFYRPDLGGRDPSMGLLEEFPDATDVQREQLQTGICGDACWDAYLPPPPPWCGEDEKD